MTAGIANHNTAGTAGTTPTPKPAASMPDNSHTSFLLLIGQVVGVIVLAWVANIDDRIGTIIVAFFVVLWLIFIMNRSDVIKSWGAKVGLNAMGTP